MLYSSGTTGRPKGVQKQLPLTPLGDPSAAPVLIASRMALSGAGPGAVYLSPAPLYHSAPLVYSMSMPRLGATVVVMEHFDAVRCLELIESTASRTRSSSPRCSRAFSRLPATSAATTTYRASRYVVHAAAPCPRRVKAPDARLVGSDHPRVLRGHRGRRLDLDHGRGVDRPTRVPSDRPMEPAHIVGPDGTELPIGEEGIVYFEGGRPFEYHNNPDATSSMTNERGWRTLGDIGRLDADGYLYLTDRAADMIIAGGVNIYPREAENVLAGHPLVADVAVIGVPDPEMGESVKRWWS